MYLYLQISGWTTFLLLLATSIVAFLWTDRPGRVWFIVAFMVATLVSLGYQLLNGYGDDLPNDVRERYYFALSLVEIVYCTLLLGGAVAAMKPASSKGNSGESAANTTIELVWSKTRVGEYTDGSPALTWQCRMIARRVSDHSIVREKVFYGSAPPERIYKTPTEGVYDVHGATAAGKIKKFLSDYPLVASVD